MSIPVNSTAPPGPSGSSNPVSMKGWFNGIVDWIRGLSPSGSTVYDTGWVAMPAETGWTVTGAYRRVGKIVMVQVDMQRTGANLSAANVTLTPIAGIPPGRVIFDSVMNSNTTAPYLAQVPITGGIILVAVTAATNQRIRGTITWVVD